MNLCISRARLTLPNTVEAVEELSEEGTLRTAVIARKVIAAKTKLGPFEARKTVHNVGIPDGFILKVCD